MPSICYPRQIFTATQIRELIFGPTLNRTLAGDFEAVRDGEVEGGIPVAAYLYN